jgi:glucose/mannose transport system substrate-binding protein
VTATRRPSCRRQFKQVLVEFKKLKGFVDAGSPGRNWNDATAMVVQGKAGVQIMGDWAKGEFAAAKQVAGKDFGCFPGFGPKAPYIVAGDAFVFPKTNDANAVKAQKLLANVVTSPSAQVAFAARKGAIRFAATSMNRSWISARAGLAIMKDKSRQLPNTEMLATPDTTGAAGCADQLLEQEPVCGRCAKSLRPRHQGE